MAVAAEKPPKVATEIQEALKAYVAALSNKDLKGCLDAFAPGPATVLMGTGPGEVWVGRDEIKAAHLEFFKTFTKQESKSNWTISAADGKVAWGAAEVAVSQKRGDARNHFILHCSMVLKKTEGKWLIAMWHFSHLTGPDTSPSGKTK
jgi:uncharacterized protein (TIGR02246 family)